MKLVFLLIVLFIISITEAKNATETNAISTPTDFIAHEAKMNRDLKVEPRVQKCQNIGGNRLYYSFNSKSSYIINSSICVREIDNTIKIYAGDDIYNKNCKIDQTVASIKECFPSNDIVEYKEFFACITTVPESKPGVTTTITTTTTASAITSTSTTTTTTTGVPIPQNSVLNSTLTASATSIPTVTANTTSIPPPSEDLSNAVTFTTSTTTVLMLLSLLLFVINY